MYNTFLCDNCIFNYYIILRFFFNWIFAYICTSAKTHGQYIELWHRKWFSERKMKTKLQSSRHSSSKRKTNSKLESSDTNHQIILIVTFSLIVFVVESPYGIILSLYIHFTVNEIPKPFEWYWVGPIRLFLMFPLLWVIHHYLFFRVHWVGILDVFCGLLVQIEKYKRIHPHHIVQYERQSDSCKDCFLLFYCKYIVLLSQAERRQCCV